MARQATRIEKTKYGTTAIFSSVERKARDRHTVKKMLVTANNATSKSSLTSSTAFE